MVKRRANKELIFKDHPEFKPNLTPKEIFQLGSFGGTYFRPIYSRVTKKNYKNKHNEFPKSWFTGLDIDKYVTSEKCDKSINKYKVKSGLSLKEWEDSGWIHEKDPYGWFQWYCRFYNGRRTKEEDERQIDRWIKYAGEKSGRWRIRLINMCIKKGKDYNDFTVSPVIRQGLQHWGYVLTLGDFNKYKNKK